MPGSKDLRACPRNPKPSALIGVGTEGKGENPGAGRPQPSDWLTVRSTVRPHPQGGFTHRVPWYGTACVYRGWWRTRPAAIAALRRPAL